MSGDLLSVINERNIAHRGRCGAQETLQVLAPSHDPRRSSLHVRIQQEVASGAERLARVCSDVLIADFTNGFTHLPFSYEVQRWPSEVGGQVVG